MYIRVNDQNTSLHASEHCHHLTHGCDLEAPLEVSPSEVLHQDVAHARSAHQHRARGVQLVVRAVHLETILIS